MFFAFEDADPDSWGRELIQEAYNQECRRTGERIRRLSTFETLLRVPDRPRQGALRLKNEGQALAKSAPARSAQEIDWHELSQAVRAYQASKSAEEVEEALQILFPHGSTALGGARPKINVSAMGGNLQIAKFPSSRDRWDVSRWEAIALELAREAGITTPNHELVELGPKESILLVDRFDREGDRRIGYVSAHTMLMQEDRDVVRASYERLAAVMSVKCLPKDRHELFRRVVFTLLVTNADDHMRNHGFLRASHGWHLSPSFDVNPMRTPGFDSTPIRRGGDPQHRTIEDLLQICEAFDLEHHEALAIIDEVNAAVRGWRPVSIKNGENPDALGFFAPMFEHENSELTKALFVRNSSPGRTELGPAG